MNDTVDTGPREPRVRTSSPFRGVAAALAAALLAGVGTAWLTRSSDPPPPPSAGAVTTPSPRTASTSPAPAPSAGSGVTGPGTLAPPPGIRPATQDPASAAAIPGRLTITRLGVDMPVVPVGVARDGEMALPATPAQVGWYRYGPRPGDKAGATVLAAHLDLPGYGVGPIAAVDELRAGDVIAVRSAEATRRYRVTTVTSIRKTSLDLAALFARDGPPLLHVVTCGGDFDREKRRYDENVVVTAEPVT
jgi:sortase (surface protein transpeptidase)